MKQIALSLAVAFMVAALPVTVPTMGQAQAAETTTSEMEAKLNAIEDRLRRTKLVIKKLKHDYLLAVKSEQDMADSGMAKEDVKHVEREFKHKVEQMIDTALEEINSI
ncbi:MAG: hypothetical protein Q9M09_02225 [Mariprofundaceae bacterium]|nr:hypothetical protein [Mariprofundaceae bacterium]